MVAKSEKAESEPETQITAFLGENIETFICFVTLSRVESIESPTFEHQRTIFRAFEVKKLVSDRFATIDSSKSEVICEESCFWLNSDFKALPSALKKVFGAVVFILLCKPSKPVGVVQVSYFGES